MAKYRLSLDIIFVSLIAALSGFLFGYHTGIISGALLFITEQFHLTVIEQGSVVSIILVGGVIGSLFGGFLSDSLGRKRTLFLTVLCVFIATFFLYEAETFKMILVGRLIAGIAIGIGSVTAPLFIAEIAPKEHRGVLVSLNQLMIVLGIFIAFWVSYLYAESADWKDMFSIGLIPAVLQGIGIFMIPESPAWLISQGRLAEAEKTLHRLEMDSSSVHYVPEEKKQDHPTSQTFKALCTPAVKTAFLVGIGLSLFQQITGINTVIYYAPHIFQLAGFASAKSAIFATTWIGIINLLMTSVGIWLVDRLGRRLLLMISMIGMTVSLAILGAAFVLFSNEAGLLAIVSVLLYIASFAIGMGMIPWLLISEIYPLGIRGRAMGIALFANWGSNYLVALTFLPMIGLLGIGWTYWVFTAIGILGIWFAYRKVPETRGKTFDEIQRFWQK